MLKNILNLNGAQQLNNQEQNSIQGGGNDNCFSANSGGGCRCDFPNYCVIVSPSSSCPSGSVPANPGCFK